MLGIYQGREMEFYFSIFAFRRCCYLTAVAATAFVLYQHINHPVSIWLVWLSLFLSLTNMNDGWWRQTRTVIFSSIAIALVFAIGTWTAATLSGNILLLLMVLAAGMFYKHQYTYDYLPYFSVLMITVLTCTVPDLSLTMADKVILLGLASGIVILINTFFVIAVPINKARQLKLIVIAGLNKLNHALYACLLDAEYSDNHYLYEKRVHDAKQKVLQGLACLRALTQSIQNKAYRDDVINSLKKLDKLNDLIVDGGQIRWRVTDHATFSVCKRELLSVLQAMTFIIQQISMSVKRNRKIEIHTNTLSDAIGRLEENYANVLQIAAREPLAFQLFIANLQAFKQEAVLWDI